MMRAARRFVAAMLLLVGLAAPAWASAANPGYAQLTALFADFRAFVPPPMVGGVPDYGPEANAARHGKLRRLMARLEAIDDSQWPIPQRVDYMLVLAEMRGMDFQHRVLQPWRRDPAFYSATNLGFGPKVHGAFRVPLLPAGAEEAAALKERLDAVPELLSQARRNLTDPRGDLARLAIAQKEIEVSVFGRLAADAARHHPELERPAVRARDAAAAFLAWLRELAPTLPAHAGVGREEYDWYLRRVLLLPYDSEEIETIGEREYQRMVGSLALEEHRNRATAMPEPLATRDEFDRRRREADEHLLRSLRDEGVMTVPDYLRHDPAEGPYILPAERDPARPGLFDPPLDLHFFFQAEFRDGRPLRAHNLPGHRFDQLQYADDPRPIRGAQRLFFVNGVRAEGWAFYLEELIVRLGMLDDLPKTREITYILGAKRAARLLPELRMHANRWTYEEANRSLVERTPKWMRPGDAIAAFDIELYLRQPGYGIGYYMGKVELEKLLAERRLDLGDDFDLKSFHDEFRAAGSIPISLIRWEMTGRDDEVRTMR